MWNQVPYLHLDGDLLLYLDLLNHGGAADVEDAARVDPHLQLDLLIAPLRGRLHLACAHSSVEYTTAALSRIQFDGSGMFIPDPGSNNSTKKGGGGVTTICPTICSRHKIH
jgi:hypothetical protein